MASGDYPTNGTTTAGCLTRTDTITEQQERRAQTRRLAPAGTRSAPCTCVRPNVVHHHLHASPHREHDRQVLETSPTPPSRRVGCTKNNATTSRPHCPAGRTTTEPSSQSHTRHACREGWRRPARAATRVIDLDQRRRHGHATAVSRAAAQTAVAPPSYKDTAAGPQCLCPDMSPHADRSREDERSAPPPATTRDFALAAPAGGGEGRRRKREDGGWCRRPSHPWGDGSLSGGDKVQPKLEQ